MPCAHSPRPYSPGSFIGIAYAVASATAILAMSKATGETEHLKDMLVGNILAVDKQEVIKTAVLYGAVGMFHYIFRHKFLLLSTDPAGEAQGMNIRFWDFLFYASFGFVVTSSVAIAGVLLVFCYLIVPAWVQCCSPIGWVRAWPLAGPWGPWYRRWAWF